MERVSSGLCSHTACPAFFAPLSPSKRRILLSKGLASGTRRPSEQEQRKTARSARHAPVHVASISLKTTLTAANEHAIHGGQASIEGEPGPALSAKNAPAVHYVASGRKSYGAEPAPIKETSRRLPVTEMGECLSTIKAGECLSIIEAGACLTEASTGCEEVGLHSTSILGRHAGKTGPASFTQHVYPQPAERPLYPSVDQDFPGIARIHDDPPVYLVHNFLTGSTRVSSAPYLML